MRGDRIHPGHAPQGFDPGRTDSFTGCAQHASGIGDIEEPCSDDHNVTIVIVEHRLADVARLADRLVLMENGRVVAEGPPE